MQDYVNINVTCLYCVCVCLCMQLGALAHWLQGQPHERIIDFNGRYAAIRKMSYHAQLTNLSMRHDTTLPPTPKTTRKSISKVHQLIPHTRDKHNSITHIHACTTHICHRHPDILSELLWHRSICVMWLLLVLK